MMEKHEEFATWAASKGVQKNGIAAHRFPGRGLGIVAEENHEKGKVILTVPTSALRTASTVPKAVSRSIGKITVHGLLAADLSLDTSVSNAPWSEVLPSRDDMEDSMPFMWPESLQDLLPAAATSLLEGQNKKYSADWAAVSKAFPTISKKIYLYHWLIVNTRTFYYIAHGSRKPPNRDDCMALNPFADYFNHAETGCLVEFGKDGFKVTADRFYEKAEEIYISYGQHSNDFLLVEYGFILEKNRWDQILLDHVLKSRMSSEQLEQVKNAGFLGNYVLDKNAVCYRTQVALRALCLPSRKWQRFVDGQDDGEGDQEAVDSLLLEILEKFACEAAEVLSRLTSLSDGKESQRKVLKRRWEQVSDLLMAAIKRITRMQR